MTPRLGAIAVTSILIAAACGDDSTLGELVDEIDAQPVTTRPADEPADEPSDEPADEPSDGPADEPSDGSTGVQAGAGLGGDEQAVIDLLSGGADVPEDEAGCLVDGIVAAGIDPAEVTRPGINLDDEIVVSDLIFACFEEPENLQGFVENFAQGFASTAGFDISVEEAQCLVRALDDSGASFADLDAPTLPPALSEAFSACLGVDERGLFEPGDSYGDNPALDRLWDDCEAGLLSACDELYNISEIGSAYEEFGATCGGRDPDPVGGACGTASEYGDDPALDAYWDACEAGDGAACDALYFESPVGSIYEAFGDTCGYRFEESPGFCEEAIG